MIVCFSIIERNITMSVCLKKHFPAILMLLLFVSTSNGQIVNVLDRAAKIPEGFSGSLSTSLQWRTGNPDLLQFGMGGDIGYQRGTSLLMLMAKGDQGEKEGERYLAKYFGHIRYRHTLSDLLATEVFVQAAHDEFRRMSIRALVGAGLRFSLVQWETGTVVYGTAYMPEYEKIKDAAEDEDEETTSHRWSNYLQLNLNPTSNLSFGGTVFAQPVIDDFDDARVSGDLYLKISAGALFLANTFHLEYNTRVPQDVEKTQTVLKSSIGISF